MEILSVISLGVTFPIILEPFSNNFKGEKRRGRGEEGVEEGRWAEHCPLPLFPY